MANLVINEKDAERLREIARREHRSIEDVISEMIDIYAETGRPFPQQSAERNQHRANLYREVREYWKMTNDAERLALSDEQLDEQFWCIDPEGIPRLKSDQDKVVLPPDKLMMMAKAAEQAGWSAEEPEVDYRKILNEEFPQYLLGKIRDNTDKQ